MYRELKYFKKIIQSNYTRLPFPHKISYIVTYKCNLRCQMCNIWKKGSTNELNLEEIEMFFKASNKFSWVGITGGEPFLKDNITDIVKIILDNCKELVAIHFASNGTMTNKIMEVVKSALKYKNKKARLLFTLSIDGSPQLHDGIRGVKGSWNRCLETFSLLKEIKSVKPRIGITLSNYNFDRFSDIFKSLKEVHTTLGFDDITINVFHKSSFYYNNENMSELNYSLMINTIDRILKADRSPFTINNFLRRKYLSLYKKYVQSTKCPLRCQALSASCVLDPRGDIYPCGIYEKRIANIKEYNYDLGKIWIEPVVKKLSKECSRGLCPSCWSPCDAYSAIGGSLFSFNLWRS